MLLKSIARGLAAGVLSLIFASLVVFALVRLSGDPALLMAPPDATPDQVQEIRDDLGLGHSIIVQYWTFASDMIRGNFGTSIEYRVPVWELYWQRTPTTFALVGVGFGLALIWGVIVGLYAASKPNGWFDYVGRFMAALGQAIPPFVLGLFLILIFAVGYGWLPPSGNEGVKSIVLPGITLAAAAAASLMRLTRAASLEVLSSDYIVLARLKGLSQRAVLWRHTFRNASLPVLTFGTLVFIHMLAGTIVIERVFNWPGIGLLMVDAIEARDYPVVQAGVVMFAAMYVVANVFVDFLYVVLNPVLRKAGDA